MADLIARKKYARAIELVQRRLETEPTSAVRLQLANLLAQAGRGTEAVPLFMDLADEFAAEGFLARAVAALKRVDKIEPGRNDVESRLQTLAREQAATARRRPLAARRPGAPPAQKAAAEPVPHPEPEPPKTAPATPEPPLPEVQAAPASLPQAPLFLESPPEPAPPETRNKGGILGVFRRLFGSAADESPKPPADEPDAKAPEPVVVAPVVAESDAAVAAATEPQAGGTGEAQPAFVEPPEKAAPDEATSAPPPVDFTQTVPGPRPGLPDEDTNPKILLPGEHPDAPPARRPRREPTPGEEFLSMPEDALLDRVEDLIEDLFVPALEPAAAAAAPAPSEEVAGGLTGLMFDELGPEERLTVLRGLKLRTFEPGDILVTEGEPPSGLYLLTAGSVKVFARDAENRNHPVGGLEEGDFFGEIASRSGLPRNATVVASASGEMLELDQTSLDHLAVSHPKVWTRMHAFARDRALQRDAALAREEKGGTSPDEAFEPKLRLRVASAFLRAGQRDEAVQILLELADELMRRGEGDKAVALLKKVERVRTGNVAPTRGAPPGPVEAQARRRPVVTADNLGQWLHGIARPSARRTASPRNSRVWADRLAEPETLRAYAGLRDCRLFDELDEEALLTLLQRLPLESCEPGDIVLTEGEPSDSVFVVAAGRLKVFVRQRTGRDAPVRDMSEGDFLGEIGVLAGLPRTATATAAAPSMLLRIGKKPLEALCRSHPHARKVLEDILATRSNNPEERSLREEPEGD